MHAAYLENIVWAIVIAFLCWLFNSGWPCVLVLCLNCPKSQQGAGNGNADKASHD